MDQPLYFAYGSNLNVDDWHRWCLSHGFKTGLLKLRTTAVLAGYRLAFVYRSISRAGGVLSLVKAAHHNVPGAVFEVLDDGWNALAVKEGAPEIYCPVAVMVAGSRGESISATTYIVRGDRSAPGTHVVPADGYVACVRAGLERLALNCEPLDAAARGLCRHPEPSPAPAAESAE